GWAAWVAAAIVCSSSLAHAECTKDTECEGENVCEAGQCTAPTPTPAPTPAPTPQAAPSAPPKAYFFDAEANKPHKVPKRIKNPGLLVGGILTATAGLSLVVYGAIANSDCSSCVSDVPVPSPPQLVGLLLMGVGVPLIVIGAKREPEPRAAISAWVSPQRSGLQLQLRL
ncbi:MAG TPA: hypothetical protein VEQ58_14650, partial [Polyangiaceae bacterium]|nr:hypothetical protein [Polyangiaceae bacterium]